MCASSNNLGHKSYGKSTQRHANIPQFPAKPTTAHIYKRTALHVCVCLFHWEGKVGGDHTCAYAKSMYKDWFPFVCLLVCVNVFFAYSPRFRRSTEPKPLILQPPNLPQLSNPNPHSQFRQRGLHIIDYVHQLHKAPWVVILYAEWVACWNNMLYSLGFDFCLRLLASATFFCIP